MEEERLKAHRVVETVWEVFWERYYGLGELYRKYQEAHAKMKESVGYEDTEKKTDEILLYSHQLELAKPAYYQLLGALRRLLISTRETGEVPDGLYEHYEAMLPKTFDDIYDLRVK